MSDFLNRISKLSFKRLALLAAQMQAKLEAADGQTVEPIAVVGIGCRLPGGSNGVAAYWQLLRDGVDAIVDVPPDRWDAAALYDPDPDRPGTMATRWGGFIDGVDQFDAKFFGIARREAESLDPQQRILLEVAWEALEHGGHSADALEGSPTGVFVSVGGVEYCQLLLADRSRNLDAYHVSGSAPSMAAGRLSYTLGLHGPSLTLDTACSSSLVAVHLACQSLRAGECRAALAGGSSLILTPETMIGLTKAHMLSPDGRCRSFDADANGIVRGEGCAVIVLKRLSDALADCDNILALLRGTAINQDGRSSGLTAPNGPAQEAVMRQALERSGLEPSDIDYLEAHGTGTTLGDPIEARALAAVLGQGRDAEQPLRVGSVKTNFGHLEITAGIAGLIKVVLALAHSEIPPHLHLKRPNPHIDWNGQPITIPTERSPWPGSGRTRRAGVSSFGFSGTNAHVIVEEAPPVEPGRARDDRGPHVLCLSAKTGPALRELAAAFDTHLAETDDAALADLCFTAASGRSHFNHRLAVVGDTADRLRADLQKFAAGERTAPPAVERTNPPPVVFLFSGQGSQRVGMGRELFQAEPVFRQALERCDEILRPQLAQPLLAVLYPESSNAGETLLDSTAYTQPALFALQYALSELWRSWGVEPTFVAGHSVGEYAAACVAGVFTLEDGLKLMAARGRLMQALPAGGAMAAVFASAARVNDSLRGHPGLSIAALNGPENTVVSGPSGELDTLLEQLRGSGVDGVPLNVSHAFHSTLVEPMLDDFERVAGDVQFRSPRIGLISNLTGGPVAADAITQVAYWRDHTREAVRFVDSIRHLDQGGHRLFVEIGPDPVLLGMAARCIDSGETHWLPSLRATEEDTSCMAKSLAELHTSGVEVDWAGFHKGRGGRRVPLPTYPFQRERYWAVAERSPDDAPGSGAPGWRDWLYELVWEPASIRDAGPREIDLDESGSWLVLADAGDGRQLAESLRARGGRCVVATRGETFEFLNADTVVLRSDEPADYRRLLETFAERGAPLAGIVHLWGIDERLTADSTSADLDRSQKRICGSLLHLLQALGAVSLASSPSLTLVTRGAQPAGGAGEPVSVAQAPLWGLARVIALEHAELRCVRVDLDPGMDAGEIDSLVDHVLLGEPEEDQLARRDGRWLALRLERSRGQQSAGDGFAVRNAGTYLVTGGLAGLGLLVAGRLVEQGARSLVLLGRSLPSADAETKIRDMEQAGASIRVEQADVSDLDTLERLFASIDACPAPLAGIVHSAGALDDGVLLQQSWARFETVMAAKVRGTWNLDRLTRDRDLDCFVMFSSGASFIGSAGQGNHAAANAFMDALSHQRRSCGLPALSINWGAWDSVGVATRGGVLERVETRGVGTIDPASGLAVLEELLVRRAVQVGVLPIRWPEFLPGFTRSGASRLCSRFAEQFDNGAADGGAAEAAAAWIETYAASVPGKRRGMLRARLETLVTGVLGLDAREAIDPRQPLSDMGFDSLMAVELRNAVGSLVGKSLPAPMLFNYPSIHELLDYLEQELASDDPRLALQSVAAPNASPAARSQELDEMTEDEMAELLAKKLR